MLGLIVLQSGLVAAHGERPRVVSLAFEVDDNGGWIPHALTNNQGVFAALKTGYKWVCEDAAVPRAGTTGLLVIAETPSRWLLSTTKGIYVSDDGGCDFRGPAAAVGTGQIFGLWQHQQTGRILAVAEGDDGHSSGFVSDDLGETWAQLAGLLPDRLTSLHWHPSNPDLLLAVGRRNIALSTNGGGRFRALELSVDNLNIPATLVQSVAWSPGSINRIIVSSIVGNRSRLILSTDQGHSWSQVAVLPDRDVQLVFNGNGQKILAASPLGPRWVSKTSGATWTQEGSVPLAIGCLSTGPKGRLFGCSQPNDGGPWVIGVSDDFGLSWMPILTAFEEAKHREDCPGQSGVALCCAGLCPGDEEPQECGQPADVEWPARCLLQPDSGGPTRALDAGYDLGPNDLDGTVAVNDSLIDTALSGLPDFTPRERDETGGEPSVSRAHHGCSLDPVSGSGRLGWWPAMMCVLILALKRRCRLKTGR